MSSRGQNTRGRGGGRGGRGGRGGQRGGGSVASGSPSQQAPLGPTDSTPGTPSLPSYPQRTSTLPPPLQTNSIGTSSPHMEIYKHIGAPTMSAGDPNQRVSDARLTPRVERKKGKINVMLVLSAIGHKIPDPADLDVLRVLKQIEELHEVTITSITDDGIISVNADSLLQADKAVQAILAALKSQAKDEEAWHPEILIGPLIEARDTFNARLKKNPDGARFVVSSSTSEAAQPTDVPVGNKLHLVGTEYRDRFQRKVHQIADSLRSNPNHMTMRVNFGAMKIQEWKKNKPTYTYADLETVARRVGRRGTFKLAYRVGAAKYHEDLIAKIMKSSDYFEPTDPRASTLQDVPAKHTLILQTGSLDIEAEIIRVMEHDKQAINYRLGPICGYPREKQHRAVEIVTLCPEWNYDWDLEVRSQVKAGSLPFAHSDLEQSTAFKAKDMTNKLPDLVIFRSFTTEFNVEKVGGKTSLAFRIKGTPYIMEVALFHNWDGPSIKGPAQVTCAVTIKGIYWHDEMTPKNIAEGPRAWNADLEELFPPVGDTHGMEVFLRCVGDIHNLLDEVAKLQAPSTQKEQKAGGN